MRQILHNWLPFMKVLNFPLRNKCFAGGTLRTFSINIQGGTHHMIKWLRLDLNNELGSILVL